MDVLWNGEKIPNSNFEDVVVYDNEGGMADSIDLLIADPENFWMQWKPTKGDLLTVSADGFSSGKMYYDGYDISSENFKLSALSIPKTSKGQELKSWENISFLAIAKEVCSSIGLSLTAYGVTDYTYSRIDRKDEEGHIGFLNRLCLREGNSLKVNDGNAVIFHEKTYESKTPGISYKKSDFAGQFRFASISAPLASACTAKYGTFEYTFTDSSIYGPKITIVDEPIYSIAEAQRYSKNYLRQRNKNEFLGYYPVKFNPGMAAGITVSLTGLGVASGEWYIKRVAHNIMSQVSHAFVRRAIEGDY